MSTVGQPPPELGSAPRRAPPSALRGPRCRGEVEPGHCRRCRGHTGAPGRCHIHRQLIVGDSESDCRDKGTEGGAGATPGSDVGVIFTIDWSLVNSGQRRSGGGDCSK